MIRRHLRNIIPISAWDGLYAQYWYSTLPSLPTSGACTLWSLTRSHSVGLCGFALYERSRSSDDIRRLPGSVAQPKDLGVFSTSHLNPVTRCPKQECVRFPDICGLGISRSVGRLERVVGEISTTLSARVSSEAHSCRGHRFIDDTPQKSYRVARTSRSPVPSVRLRCLTCTL